MRINIPASIEDATERLTGIESLLTAQRWERAAIVAAFVRLNDGPGGNDPRAIVNGDNGVMTSTQFAELGIMGLRSTNTVRTYVNRWLEHSQGVYPEPGDAVTLPDTEWEGTRGGTNGTNTADGMAAAIREMTDRHGPEAVAAAVAVTAPEVTRAVMDHSVRNLPEAPFGGDIPDAIPNQGRTDEMFDAQSKLAAISEAITQLKMHRDRHPRPYEVNADEYAERLRRMEAQIGMLAAAVQGVTDADLESLFATEGRS